jgi:hypothetical protein
LLRHGGFTFIAWGRTKSTKLRWEVGSDKVN